MLAGKKIEFYLGLIGLIFVQNVASNYNQNKVFPNFYGDGIEKSKKCLRNFTLLKFCDRQGEYFQKYFKHNIVQHVKYPVSHQPIVQHVKYPVSHQPIVQYVNPYLQSDLGIMTNRAGHDKVDNKKVLKSQNYGFGWSEPHNHHQEKKKGKHSALHKHLKKFKPPGKKIKMVWKLVPECDGFENFIKDLEILSLKFGWIGFKYATIGYIAHILNQAYIFVSLFIIGLPDRLITFVGLISPQSVAGLSQIRDAIAAVGLLAYLVDIGVSFPLGNFIIFKDTLAEIFTLASLLLASLTTFIDIVEEKAWVIFGIDLKDLFEGYGCNNPFSKEKKIEEFFEGISNW